MKKVLSLILLVALLPITCLALTACKDKQNIKNFYTSYKNIASECSHLKLVEVNDTHDINVNSYKIDIDYSQSAELQALVEDSSTKYYNLKYFYQKLLDDSLAPVQFFGEKISKLKSW